MKIRVLLMVLLMVGTACVIPIAKTISIWSAPRGEMFVLTISALQDLGYRITLIDKEMGIISAEKQIETPSGWRVLLTVSAMVKENGSTESVLDLTVSTEEKSRFSSDTDVTLWARDTIVYLIYKKRGKG